MLLLCHLPRTARGTISANACPSAVLRQVWVPSQTLLPSKRRLQKCCETGVMFAAITVFAPLVTGPVCAGSSRTETWLLVPLWAVPGTVGSRSFSLQRALNNLHRRKQQSPR